MTIRCAVAAVFSRRYIMFMLAFVRCYDSFRIASSSLNMFANVASCASALVIAPANITIMIEKEKCYCTIVIMA